jgi:hypothetical protein
MEGYTNYAKSLSNELISIKDRIRYFIDDAHWGEDGRFKEVILMKLLREKLPKNIRIGTGFVKGTGDRLTSQIDIIIYKDSMPTLFEYDDFVIVTPASVLGIIEVKSNFRTDVLVDAIEKNHANGLIIGKNIFNGIFGYEESGVMISSGEKISRTIVPTLSGNFGQVNHISVGKDYFMKYWNENDERYNAPEGDSQSAMYRTYRIEDLSFGYFISNLIYQVSYSNGNELSELSDYLYPISEGKENYALRYQDILESDTPVN